MLKTLTEKQRIFIDSAIHRWNIKEGATRSGKTYLDYLIIPKRITDVKNREGLYVLLGNTKGTLQRNIIEPLQHIWGIDLVSNIKTDNTAMLFGQRVYCLGADKTSQVDRLRGSSIKYCYGDEVVTWHPEVFNILKSRLDKPYSKFDGTCNPDSPDHWFLKFLESDADIYRQSYSIDDNTFLDPSIISNLKKEYSGTVYYDRYILGQWKRAEGTIYKLFANNCQAFMFHDLPEISEINMGVDFGGYKSGHAFVASCTDSNYANLFALASERHFGDFKPEDIDNLAIDFAGRIIKTYGRLDYIYYDNAETVLGRGLQYAMGRVYPQVSVRPAQKRRINDRILCLLRLMGSGRFWISPNSQTLIKALQEAIYSDKFQDERLDNGTSDIDSLDALEYSFEKHIKRFVE